MIGRLLPVKEALSLFLGRFGPITRPAEDLPLREILGRVLAGPIAAGEEIPNHSRSTVDGFALRASDTFGASENLPAYLRVVGEVRIGQVPGGRVGPDQAVRVPTGGMLPLGADAVAKIEDVTEVAGEIEVRRPEAPGSNVIRRGEDLASGQELFGLGHRLRPQDIGLLASIGLVRVRVVPRPRVAVISTGDEIVPVSQTPDPARARDANGHALAAAAERDGAQADHLGIFPDRPEELEAALERALKYDLILVSGGSSIGTRDNTVRCLEKLGPPGLLVHGVNIKPGKPVALAVDGEVPVLGLPGHPVSALITYRLFGRPALRRRLGMTPLEENPPSFRVRLTRSLASAPGREDFYQVRLERREDGLWAEPILGKSGLLSTMALAVGWLSIPANCEGYEAGQEVLIYPE